MVALESGDVGAKRDEVGDAIPACATDESAGGGGERLQRGEPAGAGATDDDAVGIDAAALGEEGGHIDTVLHIEDAPLAIKLRAVGAAVTGAAPVIHGGDGEAAAGEELGAQIESEGCVAGRAGMWLQDQRGTLPRGRGDGVIGGRIVGSVHGTAVIGRNPEELGDGNVVGRQARVVAGEDLNTAVGQA